MFSSISSFSQQKSSKQSCPHQIVMKCLFGHRVEPSQASVSQCAFNRPNPKLGSHPPGRHTCLVRVILHRSPTSPAQCSSCQFVSVHLQLVHFTLIEHTDLQARKQRVEYHVFEKEGLTLKVDVPGTPHPCVGIESSVRRCDAFPDDCAVGATEVDEVAQVSRCGVWTLHSSRRSGMRRNLPSLTPCCETWPAALNPVDCRASITMFGNAQGSSKSCLSLTVMLGLPLIPSADESNLGARECVWDLLNLSVSVGRFSRSLRIHGVW